MITQVELENIRIFEGSEWKFSFPLLSCYCGTNSSGKSTILKSLLLLRQSQGIREGQGAAPGWLRFIGSQVDLGNYKSFVSRNANSRDIQIGVTIEDRMPQMYFQLFRSLATPGVQSDKKDVFAEASGEEFVKYKLRARFKFGAKLTQENVSPIPEILKVDGETDAVMPFAKRGLLKEASYEIIVDDITLLTWRIAASTSSASVTGKSKTLRYDIFIPKTYMLLAGRYMRMDMEGAEEGTDVKFQTTLQGLLPASIIAKLKPEKGKAHTEPAKEQWVTWPLPQHIQEAMTDFRKAFFDINYLAPLRAAAKRYYGAPMDVSPELDPSGEFLPYVLQENGQVKVRHVRPGQSEVTNKDTLSVALNDWLHYIRTGVPFAGESETQEIELPNIENVFLEFKLRSIRGSRSHALADSGFGYSQLLPILVRGLLASPGSTLIIEQPELHLNPSLQVRLAEFFLAMVRAKKQVIIETHSEHIVNALRVLIAEDESGELAKNCGIYFLDTESAIPQMHELSIGKDGTVPEWPKSFFGEAIELTGRLLRAQKRFRHPPQTE